MVNIEITGKVKEVRLFDKSVILFLTASAPEKLCDKVVRFHVTGYSCLYPIDWAMLAVGAEVKITCMRRAEGAGSPNYSLEIINSEVIDAKSDL